MSLATFKHASAVDVSRQWISDIFNSCCRCWANGFWMADWEPCI